MRNSAYIIISILLISCNNSKITDHEINIFFNQLVGEWILDDNETLEIWDKNSNGNFVASVLKHTEHDAVLIEEIKIIKVNDAFYYEATVLNQNESKPIQFKLISISENKATFENQTHDFPQQITYKLEEGNSLVASISGKVDGIEKSINFTYQKKSSNK